MFALSRPWQCMVTGENIRTFFRFPYLYLDKVIFIIMAMRPVRYQSGEQCIFVYKTQIFEGVVGICTLSKVLT